jgi:hypothetical protein
MRPNFRHTPSRSRLFAFWLPGVTKNPRRTLAKFQHFSLSRVLLSTPTRSQISSRMDRSVLLHEGGRNLAHALISISICISQVLRVVQRSNRESDSSCMVNESFELISTNPLPRRVTALHKGTPGTLHVTQDFQRCGLDPRIHLRHTGYTVTIPMFQGRLPMVCPLGSPGAGLVMYSLCRSAQHFLRVPLFAELQERSGSFRVSFVACSRSLDRRSEYSSAFGRVFQS